MLVVNEIGKYVELLFECVGNFVHDYFCSTYTKGFLVIFALNFLTVCCLTVAVFIIDI